MRREATAWEKTSAKDTSDKRLVCKVHKELFKLSNENTSALVKTWTTELSRRQPREDLRRQASPREAAPTHVTREVQSEEATRETAPTTARSGPQDRTTASLDADLTTAERAWGRTLTHGCWGAAVHAATVEDSMAAS